MTATLIPEWTMSDRFRKARELTGMKQEEFADATGISRQTVSNYETGKTTRPVRSIAAQWALATGVPVAWLLTGDTDTDTPPEQANQSFPCMTDVDGTLAGGLAA